MSSPERLLNEVRLTLPGEATSVPLIRQVVDKAAIRCDFTLEQRAEIEMAVGEAVANIVEHGYATPPLRPQVEVLIQEFGDRLEITLCDYSTINFGADTAPEISPQEYMKKERKRGLGLHIIHHFMDHVEHCFVHGQGNILRMVKNRGQHQ